MNIVMSDYLFKDILTLKLLSLMRDSCSETYSEIPQLYVTRIDPLHVFCHFNVASNIYGQWITGAYLVLIYIM